MTEEDVKVLKDKVRYILEFTKGKQYLLVFDRTSGLSADRIRQFNEILEKEFKVKTVGLLLDHIDSMRVLTLEDTKG